MTPEDKKRVDTLRHWMPNDPNYKFLIDLIEKLEKGTILVRDMDEGSQEELPIEDFVEEDKTTMENQ